MCGVLSQLGRDPSEHGRSTREVLCFCCTLQVTGDPAGFTATDVLAMGAAGHAIGVGIVLGLKGIGAL